MNTFRAGDKIRVNGGPWEGEEGKVCTGKVIDGELIVALKPFGRRYDQSIPVTDCVLTQSKTD